MEKKTLPLAQSHPSVCTEVEPPSIGDDTAPAENQPHETAPPTVLVSRHAPRRSRSLRNRPATLKNENTMNRIYQGRVSRAEIIDEKGNVTSAPEWDWESALWEHHALFQDAVKI